MNNPSRSERRARRANENARRDGEGVEGNPRELEIKADTPEAGQTPASDSDAGEASQVSTPFHQKDLNQGEPVAAAATVGKTPERSERRRRRQIPPMNRKTPF